ncbi:zinc finger and BTB domain-containing protein 41 [Xenopus laevis]|uniref:Zinc finger and BTB domain-containing protein 41 n=2 Tax=Xenopus laevis TaxID=8355 RepID=A0A1L8GN58_XENLA|nr:zinc finger and BTB domain-containing protein 41 [Xenopus laevis]OCT85282.1 hypothetical protein XELAEV_18023447mg [Xenopus laevis]
MKKKRKVGAKLLLPELQSQKEPPKEVVTEQHNKGNNARDRLPVVPPSDERKRFQSLTYHKNLLKYLNDDRQRQASFCDLVVTVEGREFKVHKVVVAVGCSYFHACLSKNPHTDAVALDHVSSSVFQLLLDFLYSSELVVWEHEMSLVLEAAKFLDIIDAVQLLESEMVNVSTSVIETPDVANDTNSKAETSHKCPFCRKTFCYKKTLENHMGKAHALRDPGDIFEDSDPSTRKSTRRRKCPVKFENGGELESDGVSSNDFSKNSTERTDSGESSNEINEETSGIEDNGQGVDGEEALEGNNEQSEGEPEETEERNELSGAFDNFPEGLKPVVLQKNGKKVLRCPKCDKVFDRVGKYESHTRVHTGEKPFECDICHQRYSTKSNLTVHRKRHNNETEIHRKKKHKCPFCNKPHASRKTLSKHVKRFHPENAQEFLSLKRIKSDGWKCDVCNKSFTRRPHLEEHMILHSQDKPFKCTYCEEHFKSRFTRLKHQEKFHLGPFPCNICGRHFNDTGNMKRHIEYTHGGKRKWTCFICGKSVRERTTLKEHLRIHSGEKPHLCSICGQSFRHGSSYRLHLRVHHDDKRYECDECGKTFIRHDHLTKHKKIHSGEKAHQCEECGKCFGRRDHLTVHYKSVHLGEKVWQKYKATFHQCEVCKKVFKGKSSLEMHFRTHSGEKPYKCHICNQSFRIKKTLTKHLVIHSDARPFNCQHCNATFKRKDKLKYHIDHVHGSKVAEEETGADEEPKSFPVTSENTSADICVPLTLVPIEMAESEGDLGHHTGPSAIPSAAEYQQPSDLAFLEKYTLTPQPATLLHPVRPDQILESREHSYLGTLLGLDPQPPVQNVTNEHH